MTHEEMFGNDGLIKALTAKILNKAVFVASDINMEGRKDVFWVSGLLKMKEQDSGKYSEMKVLYLALQNTSSKWSMPIRDWDVALNQFALVLGDWLTL